MMSFCGKTVLSYLGLNRSSQKFHQTDNGLSLIFLSDEVPNVLQSVSVENYAAAEAPTDQKKVQSLSRTTVDVDKHSVGKLSSDRCYEASELPPPLTSLHQDRQPKKSFIRTA